ncbi:hypothetical protein M0802_001347 [Mischocyttarus mexicanus]|nr:hypothetical protein M0802_001347 [Mischocyttarus mexicanus]
MRVKGREGWRVRAEKETEGRVHDEEGARGRRNHLPAYVMAHESSDSSCVPVCVEEKIAHPKPGTDSGSGLPFLRRGSSDTLRISGNECFRN